MAVMLKIKECDNAGAVKIADCDNIKKGRKSRRKKLRRLANSVLEKNKNQLANKCRRVLIIIALITFTIALLMGHYLGQNNYNTKQLFQEFLKNYRNQYTEIVHGKLNYCDQKQQLDTATLFRSLKENYIIHQEQAMQQIERALRNEDDINAIALVGSVGVGKSLFMRALEQNFPWRENVNTYAWNTYVKNEADKFHLIRKLIDNLSDCGQNLLVIENLQAYDHGVVSAINQLLKESNSKKNKRIVVFYVFSLNTMLDTEAYATQLDLLQSLPDCKTIHFQSFTHQHLKDCIRHEAEVENISLTVKDFDEIVETIDPFKSGCKNVKAKVLMYGTMKTSH